MEGSGNAMQRKAGRWFRSDVHLRVHTDSDTPIMPMPTLFLSTLTSILDIHPSLLAVYIRHTPSLALLLSSSSPHSSVAAVLAPARRPSPFSAVLPPPPHPRPSHRLSTHSLSFSVAVFSTASRSLRMASSPPLRPKPRGCRRRPLRGMTWRTSAWTTRAEQQRGRVQASDGGRTGASHSSLSFDTRHVLAARVLSRAPPSSPCAVRVPPA